MCDLGESSESRNSRSNGATPREVVILPDHRPPLRLFVDFEKDIMGGYTADQKRWFKVWTSILSDDDFDPGRGLTSIGRFSMLGAYTALHGEKGVVEIMPDTLFRLAQAQSLDDLRNDLACKNILFEEGKNRHGKITVTWEKWIKYQEDSTQAERAKASRSKRRGEERREEDIRREEKPPSPFELFWIAYPKKKSKGQAEKAWKVLNPSSDLQTKILQAIEVVRVSPEWRKERGQFIPYPATWLRAKGWEDETMKEEEWEPPEVRAARK